MHVTKLERSGYMLELPDSILVFDYTRDQGHHVEKALREQPEKAVVFFVTHNHRYTFDTGIFNMAQSHRRVYVLSNDIPTREIHDDMPIAWMSAGDRIEDVAGKGINVEALDAGSGIAYYVTAGDAEAFDICLCTACREQLYSELVKFLYDVAAAVFVVDRDKGCANFLCGSH